MQNHLNWTLITDGRILERDHQCRQELTHIKTVCHLSGNGQVHGFLLHVSLGRDCCKKDHNDRKTF